MRCAVGTCRRPLPGSPPAARARAAADAAPPLPAAAAGPCRLEPKSCPPAGAAKGRVTHPRTVRNDEQRRDAPPPTHPTDPLGPTLHCARVVEPGAGENEQGTPGVLATYQRVKRGGTFFICAADLCTPAHMFGQQNCTPASAHVHAGARFVSACELLVSAPGLSPSASCGPFHATADVSLSSCLPVALS